MPKPSGAAEVRSSQEALVCGEAFQRLAEKLIPSIRTVKEGASHFMPDEMGDLVVCATNLAFAVELYLKGLLIQLGLDVPMDHNLRNLYGAVPQSVRTMIESTYDTALPDELRRLAGHVSFTLAKGPLEAPQWNDYKVSLALPDLLARSKDLFVSWRYVFEFCPPEGNSYQVRQFEYGLLRCAAEVLRVELTVRLHEVGERQLPNLPPSES
jgi:HEPN domain